MGNEKQELTNADSNSATIAGYTETGGNDSLLLKWGTVKRWDFKNEDCEAWQLLKEYLKDSPLSCMANHPTEERKELLCKVIDKLNGEIQNDWTGEIMTKEEAKKYILQYGKS